MITWPDGRPEVEDEERFDASEGLKLIKPSAEFSSIHMASKGYWQIQDDAD